MKRVKIRRVSAWSMVITIAVGALFFVISSWTNREFRVLQTTIEQYILCEKAATNLQDGSDYLTEQVRLYVMTGQQNYLDSYFEEADHTRRRENALDVLQTYFDGTHTFSALRTAMDLSIQLMDTEYYAMRLVLEAGTSDQVGWPAPIQAITLSADDEALSSSGKLRRAQQLVCDDNYQSVRNQISVQVSRCLSDLIQQTRNQQSQASTVFFGMYQKLEMGIGVLVVIALAVCVLIRRLVVLPILKCNESIKAGEPLPVAGAEELQVMAETYNKVHQENKASQALIRHKADHDAITNLLNRSSFEKLLGVYEQGTAPFALIIIDVDRFKSVNDTYGHTVGDKTLKNVASLLYAAFRSIDHIFRIGGDEFAIIMVEMTSDLSYTIQEKVDAINQTLAQQDDGLPKVSLSVGVAFSDRPDPTGTIFQDADQALYHQKNHGKAGCSFYQK